jgi:hypothetical protein
MSVCVTIGPPPENERIVFLAARRGAATLPPALA